MHNPGNYDIMLSNQISCKEESLCQDQAAEAVVAEVAAVVVSEEADSGEAVRAAECHTAVVSTDHHPDPDIMAVGIMAAVITEADASGIFSACS